MNLGLNGRQVECHFTIYQIGLKERKTLGPEFEVILASGWISFLLMQKDAHSL